jgi:hypothetical protein
VSTGDPMTTSDTSEDVCVCTADLPACDADFTPGAECNHDPRCCHTDGPYTCLCPEAPPCTWTKDPCA